MCSVAAAPAPVAAGPDAHANEEAMVVRLSQLDNMLELAGEVIIVSSNLNAISRQMRQGEAVTEYLNQSVKDLAITSGRISSDLHNLVTDVRTVDMRDLFARFRRLARDTSRRLGKAIRFETGGEDICIDKKLSEQIYDPIAHQIRNAISHGIEDDAARRAAGKDPVGDVTVRVLSKEHNTLIQVIDDGAGIDVEAVRRRIIEQGWADESTAARLTHHDVLEYLYLPGFSTADQASVTAGRGVGMDVIRTVMNEVGGETRIETEPGQGTTFTFVLPKVTAVNISDALIVQAGKTYFAFPVLSVVASRSIGLDEITTVTGQGRTIQYLGKTLPLFDLLEVFGEPPVEVDGDVMQVILVEHKSRLVAYTVTDFLSPQKIVISEVRGVHVPGLSGTAALSGRQMCMVIDLPRLFEQTFGQEDDAERRAGPAPLQRPVTAGELPDTPTDRVDSPDDSTAPAPGESQVVTADQDDPSKGPAPDVEFLREVEEMLSRLNRQLLELDDTRDPQQADGIFRLVHSIKGNLTMYGAEEAASVSHRVETLLARARDGEIELADEIFDVMFDGAGYLEQSVKAFLKGDKAPEPGQDLLDALARWQQSSRPTGDPQPAPSDPSQLRLDATGEFYLSSRRRDGASIHKCRITFECGDQPEFLVAYLILRRIQSVADVLGSTPTMAELEDGRSAGQLTVLIAPRDGRDDLLERLRDNLQRYFGVTGFEAASYV
jgi:chemotaxis protein histidine kinase CheA